MALSYALRLMLASISKGFTISKLRAIPGGETSIVKSENFRLDIFDRVPQWLAKESALLTVSDY